MKKKMIRSVRLDNSHMEHLEKMNVNVSELIRELISGWIKSKDCPVCGTNLKLNLKKESEKKL